jgi:phage terminase large subunit-like protein
MPHVSGDWAGRQELIRLENWQIFILAVGFGWIVKATGKRRFRNIDAYIPRKNAKSTISAIVALYMLTMDDEYAAEVLCGASNKEQADKVFVPALNMAIKTPEFRAMCGVIYSKTSIAVPDTLSKMSTLIGKPGDGASPSCAVVDEYHEHDTSDLFDTMTTGMLARSQPMLLMITTAGSDISGPCYMHQLGLQKILEGTLENDRRFGIIFTIDDDDDWSSEDSLRKANPNYGISVNAETLLADLKVALDDPIKQATFKTKHLNIWVNSKSPWINQAKLIRCADPSLTLDSFISEDCIIGLDLASKEDIAAVTYEFIRQIDGKSHYYIISKNYLPEAVVERPENAHYARWVAQNYITKTSGNMIDLELIQEQILQSCDKVKIKTVRKDQSNSAQLGANLMREGLEVVDVPQTVRHLSEPMKDIAALINGGRFHYDGNKAFEWMLLNVVCSPDANENIFPRKAKDENKIDGATALIISHGRAMLNEVETETPEIIFL